jgi:hypothetical protein
MADNRTQRTERRVWPMDLAPRDGTWIRAWCNGPSGSVRTCWREDHWHVPPHHECFPFAWEADAADDA